MKKILMIAIVVVLAVALFNGFVFADEEVPQFTVQYTCIDENVYPGTRVTLTAKYSTEINTGYIADNHAWKFQWYVNDTNSNTGGVKIPLKPNAPEGVDYMRIIPVKNEDGVFPGYSQGVEYIPNTTEVGTKYYYCEITHTAGDGTDEIMKSEPVGVTVVARPVNHPLDSVLTYAEKSGWTESASSADVIAFYEEVAAESGGRVRLTYSGETAKGKKIPLVLIGNPAPSKPAEVSSDKAVILLNASLHSGEVEGKESMMLFTREIAKGMHDDILEDVVLLIVANGNPDGNDTLNRSGINQYTPKYYGNRTNTAVGTSAYNINRDMMKLVTAEGTALTSLFNDWEPEAFVDLHTTNGSFVRVPMETLWNLHPDMDATLMDYNGDEFVDKIFGEDSYFAEVIGEEVPPYGDFNPSATGYRNGGRFVCGADERPVYTSHYGGMRNRISLLFEVYSHDAYTLRVDTMYSAVKSLVYTVQDEKDEIKDMIAAADEQAVARADASAETEEVTISVQRITETTHPGQTMKINVPSYLATEAGGNTRYIVTDDYGDRAGSIYAGDTTYTDVSWEGPFEVTKTTPMGAYYLLDADCGAAVAALRRHGIQVTQLTEAVTLGANEFQWFEAESRTTGTWENNPTNTITGDWKTPSAQQIFPEGTYVVSTAQVHGNLAALLLEPGIRDSVVYYHFLNYQMENYAGSVRANYISVNAGNIAIPIYKVASFSSLPSNIAYLKNVLGEDVPVGRETGTDLFPKTAERTVAGNVAVLKASDIVSRDSNATVKFGVNPGNLGTSDVTLQVGENTVYAEVTAEDGQTKLYYTLNILREEQSFTVTFVIEDPDKTSKQTVERGKTVSQPTDPVKSGYTFTGWYTDKACTQKYNFTTPVTADLTIYAGWEKVKIMPYIDGYTDGTFGPDLSITRAEAAKMLYNLYEGELIVPPDKTNDVSFTDVKKGTWYYDAIMYLADKGIVEGYEDDTYGHGKTITRAEFSTIIVRCMEESASGTASFPDVPKNHWATGYIAVAEKAGLVEGYDNGKFGPEDNLTRAQAVTILNRLLDRNTDKSLFEGMKMPFSDVASSHWAWSNIMAAAVEHTA